MLDSIGSAMTWTIYTGMYTTSPSTLRSLVWTTYAGPIALFPPNFSMKWSSEACALDEDDDFTSIGGILLQFTKMRSTPENSLSLFTIMLSHYRLRYNNISGYTKIVTILRFDNTKNEISKSKYYTKNEF